MDPKTGELVRARRSKLGLRLTEVAELARVPAETLEAFEEGRGTITAAALDRVCYALSLDSGALREGRIERRPTASVFFLHGSFPDFRDVEDRPKLAMVFDRSLALIEINRLLGRPAGLRTQLEPEEPTPQAAMDGYRLARDVRSKLGNETDPLLDIVAMLEDRFDVLVRMEALESWRMSALAMKEPQTGAAAVVLNTMNERRANPHTARVDLVHELGHILFDPANGEVNLIVDDESDDERTLTHAEMRARAFAAELLLPLEGLRRLLGKPRYEMSAPHALELVARARNEFLTPIEITVNHLVNREYIVHWLREPLIEQARRAEPPRDVAAPRAPVVPAHDLLERRVLEALARGLISGGRARELLGLSAWDELPADA